MNKFDPEKWKKAIDIAVKILTFLGGLLAGFGTASACTLLF